MDDMIELIRENVRRAEAEHERARWRLRAIAETLVVGALVIVFVVLAGR